MLDPGTAFRADADPTNRRLGKTLGPTVTVPLVIRLSGGLGSLTFSKVTIRQVCSN